MRFLVQTPLLLATIALATANSCSRSSKPEPQAEAEHAREHGSEALRERGREHEGEHESEAERERERAAEREREIPKPPADAERSPSGLISKVLKPGAGEQQPKLYDQVRVQYTVWRGGDEEEEEEEEEEEFPRRSGPDTFAVTGVIAGWTEALQQMRVGEQRRLWVPDQLAYPGRPGNARPPAVFDLELLAIIEGEPPRPAPKDVAAPPKDAKRTASGLAYKLLAKPHGGDKPNAWDRVTLRYTGWTADGAMVERSSGDKGAVFDLDAVMPGWREGLSMLSVGDRARLWLPEALAYQGRTGWPRGPVVFDVELLSIERRPKPPQAPPELAAPPDGAHRTESGLAYRILERGAGKDHPSATDRVQVQYSAWTHDGALFDSSVTRGKPVTVPLSRLIPGWAEGLQHMVEGDRARLWIPEQLAYGNTRGGPRGMLVYDVELLKIVR